MKRLMILGAGGYGKTVADVAAQLGCYEQIVFLDDAQISMTGFHRMHENSRTADTGEGRSHFLPM